MDYLEPPQVEIVIYAKAQVKGGQQGAPDCWPSSNGIQCYGDPPDHPPPGPIGPPEDD